MLLFIPDILHYATYLFIPDRLHHELSSHTEDNHVVNIQYLTRLVVTAALVYTHCSFMHCLKLCPNRCLSNLFIRRQNWGWSYHFKAMLRAPFGHSRGNSFRSCRRMVFLNSSKKYEGTDPLGLYTDRC